MGEKEEQIRKMIDDYYTNVFLKECGALNAEVDDSYILDLNVDVENDAIRIIELNPFAVTTGPGFFDWKEDKEILYGQVDDEPTIYPVIRFRTEREKHLSAVLSQWDPLLKEFEAMEHKSDGDADEDDGDAGDV